MHILRKTRMRARICCDSTKVMDIYLHHRRRIRAMKPIKFKQANKNLLKPEHMKNNYGVEAGNGVCRSKHCACGKQVSR